MLKLNSLILFSENPKTLVAFYQKVFQLEPTWSEGDWTSFTVGDVSISFGPHDKVKGKNTNPERMFFNLETTELEKEFERIVALGAKVIAKPYHMGEDTQMMIATLADPDGNYFQLNTPFKE